MIYRSLPSSNYKPSVCSWKTHHHGGIILYKTIILDAVYWCMISVAVDILRHNVYWSLVWWTRSSRAMSGSIKTCSVPSGLAARNSWIAHPGQVEADYKTQNLQYSPLTLPPVPPHTTHKMRLGLLLCSVLHLLAAAPLFFNLEHLLRPLTSLLHKGRAQRPAHRGRKLVYRHRPARYRRPVRFRWGLRIVDK